MQRIEEILNQAFASPENRLGPDHPEPAFDAPLIGVSLAADPIWRRIKDHIGDFYWLPHEAFALAYPDAPLPATALRVISWILPQTGATRGDHRACKQLPSPRWSLARHYGEKFNEFARRALVAGLAKAGVRACAPALMPQWSRQASPDYGFASTWSERHAAFAAGLGCFGLSDGLITARGKAVRAGSVIAAISVPAAPRPYGDDHRAYCLFFATGKCLACAKRCPAGAISAQGHDKQACHNYIRGVTAPHVQNDQLGFPVNSCGLCQTGVPCEARIPKNAGTNRGPERKEGDS
ncbi:MAG: 4Fe-4S ferredoxin [Desulfovibrionaceae bacterium]|nr:4Fe-4S ferredoxin [Desulfovibrionaceae bacterium]MBF0515402.1 4Fe-4S ferredoxin [Desulfovibrionaceae bacterium]